MKRVAVVGTDTEVGKTVVSAGLFLLFEKCGKKVFPYKPFASGAFFDGEKYFSEDALILSQVSGCCMDRINPNLFKLPLAPLVASREEGVIADISMSLKLLDEYEKDVDLVLMEGVGGLMVPIADNYLFSDFLKESKASVIVVGRAGLGTINHTLLTIGMLRKLGISIRGVILNGYDGSSVSEKTNAEIIEEFSGVEVVGNIPFIDGLFFDNPVRIDKDKLLAVFENAIDFFSLWEKIFS